MEDLIMELLEESDNVVEDSSWIYSMANIRKRRSGLPVNIWVDESREYLKGGHGKRIKFQINHADTIQKEFLASITLNGEVIKETYNNAKSELNASDIKQIINFTLNNAYALNVLSDGDVFDIGDFLEVMIPGGKPATSEQIEEQKQKVLKIIQNA